MLHSPQEHWDISCTAKAVWNRYLGVSATGLFCDLGSSREGMVQRANWLHTSMSSNFLHLRAGSSVVEWECGLVICFYAQRLICQRKPLEQLICCWRGKKTMLPNWKLIAIFIQLIRTKLLLHYWRYSSACWNAHPINGAMNRLSYEQKKSNQTENNTINSNCNAKMPYST